MMYPTHPAAEAFPLLDGAEYRALRDDIAAHGVHMPLVLTPDGMLLDGRNRLRACTELHISPPTIVYDGEPVSYVVSLNIARRHLNESQRAMVAARLATMGKGGDKKSEAYREHKINAQICALIPQPEAAEMLSVSRRSVQNATAVLRAVADGTIDAGRVENIDRGRETVSRVLRDVRQVEERAVVAAVHAQPVNTRYTLVHTTVADFTPASPVDAIVTDPPYPRAYLDVYTDLAHFACRALKPGGSLFVMVGQSYLPDILARMAPIIRYHWTLAYLTPGGQSAQLWERKVNTFWKPVLWFVHGDYAGKWHGDVAQSAPNDNDKRFHEWGQSLSGMAALLEKHTNPGDCICDPFCGGGATGAAALATGRLFLGGDCDAQAIETTQQRLRGMPWS